MNVSYTINELNRQSNIIGKKINSNKLNINSTDSNSEKLILNKKPNINVKERNYFKTNTMVIDSDKLNLQNSKFDFMINKEQRKDRRGVPILKGSKNHKVTFIDKIGMRNIPFAEKIEIESYKAQNAFNSFREDGRHKSNSSVSCCFIF